MGVEPSPSNIGECALRLNSLSYRPPRKDKCGFLWVRNKYGADLLLSVLTLFFNSSVVIVPGRGGAGRCQRKRLRLPWWSRGGGAFQTQPPVAGPDYRNAQRSNPALHFWGMCYVWDGRVCLNFCFFCFFGGGWVGGGWVGVCVCVLYIMHFMHHSIHLFGINSV